MDEQRLAAAAAAIDRGELVVYPTETVYGLGADALDPAAIERVYEAKERPRDRPLSLGVPSVDEAVRYVQISERTRAFMDAFLPGPVTVVCPREQRVPDALTAGSDRVGIRVPDHEVALSLLKRTGPLTATSANRSGTGSVTDPARLDEDLRESVAVILDDGPVPGGESTVVDPERNEIHRHGSMVEAVRSWLADHPV